MKKLVSLVLALALCLGLAAPALAVEYTGDGYTLDFVGSTEIEEVEVPFRRYDSEAGMAVGDPTTIKAVRMNVGDVIKFTAGSAYTADYVFHMYAPSGVGYTRTKNLAAVFGNNDNPTTETVILDPVTFNDHLDIEDGTLFLIECHINKFMGDYPETIDTCYILLNGTFSGSGVQPSDEPVDDTPAGEVGDDTPAGEVGDDTPAGETLDDTPAAEPTTTPVEGGVVYTVKQYDTMGKIALNYYGSYGYHLELYKANADAFAKTGGNFNTGMTLTLPDTLAGKARLAEPTLAEGESFYTVKAGDTLGAIAAATYGDIMMYEEIYERNADRLKNANTIFEGQVIVLPAK